LLLPICQPVFHLVRHLPGEEHGSDLTICVYAIQFVWVSHLDMD
jgi:hypothetical protein